MTILRWCLFHKFRCTYCSLLSGTARSSRSRRLGEETNMVCSMVGNTFKTCETSGCVKVWCCRFPRDQCSECKVDSFCIGCGRFEGGPNSKPRSSLPAERRKERLCIDSLRCVWVAVRDTPFLGRICLNIYGVFLAFSFTTVSMVRERTWVAVSKVWSLAEKCTECLHLCFFVKFILTV